MHTTTMVTMSQRKVKKKKRVYTEVILMRITRYSGIWL
jgi:hypothetical protein